MSRSTISNLCKLVVYRKRSLRTQACSLNPHFAKFCSDRPIIQLRSLAVLGQSAQQQNLEVKICEKILLSKQSCEPGRASSVDDLVYGLNHNLNHQWTAAIIIKTHGGEIYDVGTEKNIYFAIKNSSDRGGGLICRTVKDIIL
ncbi:hypothetical protein ACTXT7_006958 [Hymenolepis weldensis]